MEKEPTPVAITGLVLRLAQARGMQAGDGSSKRGRVPIGF